MPAPAQPPTSNQMRASGQVAPAKSGYATPTAAPPSTTPPPLVEPKTSRKPAPPSNERPSTAPAPPSVPTLETPKLPSPERPPVVDEGTSYFDTYAVSPRSPTRAAGDRFTAGFWNLTDHDVSIKVDGQTHALTRGKSLSVDVGKQFVWQVEGRDPQKEQIATGESAIEIVIRR